MSVRICCDGPDKCQATMPTGTVSKASVQAGWVYIPATGTPNNVLRPEKHLCPKCVLKLIQASENYENLKQECYQRVSKLKQNVALEFQTSLPKKDVLAMIQSDLGWMNG